VVDVAHTLIMGDVRAVVPLAPLGAGFRRPHGLHLPKESPMEEARLWAGVILLLAILLVLAIEGHQLLEIVKELFHR